ncbi:DNA gyrase inhibitor SbmC [Cronobacter dublinensis]|uniref:DNA gyrase inhibitor SbmC n=1 Tax=Cronobacter dublinensis TaxID=413497 RepID=UPI0010719D5D|nr:DNA gyrase inhibitor SbmC [Cronobacter dublinensis]MDK1191961.1 DNA gyrase inhibitor SbmC [Cronobacter dublinensis]MDK1202129.1 DNA gyrase inhibitor SbmC [Cronobacter dublinensis]
MDYTIEHVVTRKVAGFHLVGPWEKTVPQGFEQLVMWVDNFHIQPKAWIAVYYDNPQQVAPEKLRADTVVEVPADFTVPENSVGVVLTDLPGGQYAVARARVENNDFGAPWLTFFTRLHQDVRYQMAARPCFEIYLNDGKKDGYWDIDMYIPVQTSGE